MFLTFHWASDLVIGCYLVIWFSYLTDWWFLDVFGHWQHDVHLGRSRRVHCSSSDQLLRMGSCQTFGNRRWPWEISRSMGNPCKSFMSDFWQFMAVLGTFWVILEHIETIWNHAWKQHLAGVLPVTIAGVQGLRGCLWHFAECEDLGEGWTLHVILMDYSRYRWDQMEPDGTRCWTRSDQRRWWVPGGLHCWWGLRLHLQSLPEFSRSKAAERLYL